MSTDDDSRPDDVADPGNGPGGAPADGPSAAGPPQAPDEETIRRELGIGGGSPAIPAGDVEELLRGALEDYGQVLDQARAAGAGGAPSTGLPATGADLIDQNLELLRDVHLQVKVELGRGRMYLKDILRLGQGSVVELERLAGDPLDIYVNDKVIARGEVLVLNENFCIRITQVFHPEELRHGS